MVGGRGSENLVIITLVAGQAARVRTTVAGAEQAPPAIGRHGSPTRRVPCARASS